MRDHGRVHQLFGSLLAFVYHCFDRIVIHGYLSGLSRPEQVVYFVPQVLGLPVVSPEVLRQRTEDYRDWVEAYAATITPHRVGGKYYPNNCPVRAEGGSDEAKQTYTRLEKD